MPTLVDSIAVKIIVQGRKPKLKFRLKLASGPKESISSAQAGHQKSLRIHYISAQNYSIDLTRNTQLT